MTTGGPPSNRNSDATAPEWLEMDDVIVRSPPARSRFSRLRERRAWWSALADRCEARNCVLSRISTSRGDDVTGRASQTGDVAEVVGDAQ